MFFIISKIISFLFDPFFWIITCLICSIFWRKKELKKRFQLGAIILLLFFSNTMIYNTLFNLWSIDNSIKNQQFEYGILMGGMISLSSSEENIFFNQHNDRLLNCIELYQKGQISKIIITGASGSITSEMPEAEILKKFLVRIGIPENHIITESESQNTYENAQFTANLLTNEDDNPTCVLITSNYHMRRALACFEKTALRPVAFGKESDVYHFDLESAIIPQSNVLFQWKTLLHEIVGHVTYKIMGYN